MENTNLPHSASPSELAALQTEIADLRMKLTTVQNHQRRAGRRARVAACLVAVVIGTAFLLNARPAVLAQAPATSLGSLVATVNALTGRVAALEYKTAPFSRTDTSPDADEPQGGTEITLSGANLHIVNGMGQTDGIPNDPYDEGDNQFAVNGLGNLIIGYNERRSRNFVDNRGGTSNLYRVSEIDKRTGSHNLIIGVANNYTGVGGIVAGEYNQASSNYAEVTGGAGNIAAGSYASVSGGYFNTAAGEYASVTGGGFNHATGNYASIACGANNLATSEFGSISGGQALLVTHKYGWAAGGIYDPTFTLKKFGPGSY